MEISGTSPVADSAQANTALETAIGQ